MQKLYQWEKRVILRLSSSDHPAADKLMLWATRMGNGGLVWIAVSLIMMGMGWRLEGLLTLIALTLTAVLINLVVKPMFTRKRPYEILETVRTRIAPPFGSSFPSGHAASSFAAASMLWFFNMPFKHWALALALLIAVSRVHLMVHFPSDVLVGAVSGIVISYLTYLLALRVGIQVARARLEQLPWLAGQAKLTGGCVFCAVKDSLRVLT